MPVFAVLLCTSAKHGHCKMYRIIKLTPSTNNISTVFLELGGNIRLSTKKCWDILVSPLCTPPSANAGIAGLVIFWRWATISKDLLYSELVVGKHNIGWLRLIQRYLQAQHEYFHSGHWWVANTYWTPTNGMNGTLLSTTDCVKGKIFLRISKKRTKES